jgi:ubiquinone/menaquinone biosynthesis C-methylase UbiE
MLAVSPEGYSCSKCRVNYEVVEEIPLFTQKDVSYKDEFTRPNLRVSPFLEFLYRYLHFYHWNERCFFEENVKKGNVILDLGCGGGKELFPRKGAYCVGLDISLQALLSAATVYHQVARCDILSLPFEDNTFDCVISSHVLGHISDEKKDILLKEIYRVLKKGGKAINVIETDSLNPFIREAKHYPACYQKYFVEREGHYGLELPSETIERFKKIGFTLVSCKKRNAGRVPLWYYAIYFDNEFLKEFPVNIQRKVCFAKKMWGNRYFKILMGFLQGIYQDTWGQRFTKLDHAIGISTMHYK